MKRIQEEFKKSSCGALVSLSRDLRVLFFGLLMMSVPAYGIDGDISRMGDATHLEFKGLPQWNYDIARKEGNKVHLLVPTFSEATELRLKSWSDSLIKEVEVRREAPDGRYEVIFTLAGKDVEHFDYLTDEPSRLIVDFYKQVNETAEQPQPTQAPTQQAPSSQKSATQKLATKPGGYTEVAPKKGRSPAGGEILEVFHTKEDEEAGSPFPMRGVFDGGDPHFDRFRIKNYQINENSIIANKENIYIKFPYLNMPVSELDQMMANTPEYVIHPKDTQENKEARLLLHLYGKGRQGAFLKTFDYFAKKYPDSEYDEIVRNLAAEYHFKNYLQTRKNEDFQKAEKLYRYLLNKYPDSPLSERSSLLLAYANLERGDALATLQSFQSFLEKFPGSEKRDQAKKALAEAYLKIHKYKEALSVYEDLAKNADSEAVKVEALYRRGDVYVAQQDHVKAAEAYNTALKEYPAFERTYPNAHYNLGESYFWMPDYEKSLDHFVSFLERYPSHSYGGYAMTRIGELLEILGADRSKVMGAFLESYFRFKGSPGAQIARVRMISQRMKGMKEKELRDSLAELEHIVKDAQFPRISEFVTLMIADGYYRRGEYDKSLNYLIGYYQQNPTSTDLSFFKKRILKNISEGLRERIADNKYMEALQEHEAYSKTWLRNQDRLDIPYFLGQAYEQAGVFEEANKIYSYVKDKVEAIRGTQEEKERRINEHLPTEDQLHLRLAFVESRNREYAKSENHLGQIKKPQELGPQEQIQMVELMAEVSEERGNLGAAKTALSKLAKSWQGQPKLLVPVYIKLSALHRKTKDYLDSEKAAQEILSLKEQGIEVPDSQLELAYELKADSQYEQGKELAAVETYSELFDKLGNNKPMPALRFKAGDILYSRGDSKGAEKLWQSIEEKSGAIYKRLASEKMEHARWQDEYKKYLQRIPAMSEIK